MARAGLVIDVLERTTGTGRLPGYISAAVVPCVALLCSDMYKSHATKARSGRPLAHRATNTVTCHHTTVTRQ